ncbi:hypothetical protein AX774_g3935 [Zancudomyces culisetae]|uniref:SH3 domain-containing protein n=1 Tax=Zancudomyces culisetae TaxID=1213189 RepID=A0A1R1PNV2_ZANCU|nr:hypothetical protein AX774_g6451 [Zancudomyces culisetae]OMH82583.1 hypothetical protein AX774_g3935 [Zancudomyces culisetae]|eukprot:OMH80124.1 hypothetical protein AX774_g6451 [Zancudomyces culisetae]
MWLLRRWGGGKNNKMLNRLYMWGKKPVLGGTDNAFNYSGAQEKMLKGGIGYLDSTKGVDLKNVDSNEKTLEYDFVDMFLECVGKPREVHSTFFANREDEIGLKVGEKVLVQIAFDDGWAVGKNTNTDEEGTFPLACLFRTPPLQLPNAWTNLEASRINSDGNSVNESVENSPMSKTIKSESYKRDYSSTRIKTNNATGVDDKKSVMGTNLNHGLVYTFKNTNTAPIGNGGQYEKKPMHLGLVDSRQEYNGLNTKSREIPSDKETQANVTFDNSSSNISTILKINDESIATNGSRVGINSSSGIQKLQPAILNKSISKIRDTFSGPRSPMKQSVRRAKSKGKAEKIVGEDSEQINKQMDTQGTSGFFTDMEYMENNSNMSSSSNESFVNHSTDTQDDKNQLEQHELGVGFDDFPTPVLQNLRLDTIDKKGSYELGKILQTKKSKTSVGNVVNSSSDGVLKNFKVA